MELSYFFDEYLIYFILTKEIIKLEILYTRRLYNKYRREDGKDIWSNYFYQNQPHIFAILVQFPTGSGLLSENNFIKLHGLFDITYMLFLKVFVLPSTRCY